MHTTEGIQQTFLDYFDDSGHLITSGRGIVAIEDPTLLFINSGMAPMKNYFTGGFLRTFL